MLWMCLFWCICLHIPIRHGACCGCVRFGVYACIYPSGVGRGDLPVGRAQGCLRVSAWSCVSCSIRLAPCKRAFRCVQRGVVRIPHHSPGCVSCPIRGRGAAVAARLMPHRIALGRTAPAAYKRMPIIFYTRQSEAKARNRPQKRATPRPTATAATPSVTSASGGRSAERGSRRIHEGSRPTHYHGWH